MKYIKNTVSIVALFAVLSAHAKQVNKQTTSQPQPQPTPVIPQPRPVIIPEPETGPTYSQILSSLQKKKPDSSDYVTLKNIKGEAEVQMRQIEISVEKKPISSPQEISSQVLHRAKPIFKEYSVNFDRTQQQIDAASRTDEDLFTQAEQNKITEAIYNIVKALVTEFPTLSSQQVYNVIVQHHPGFNALAKKLTKDQYDDITDFLKRAIDIAYGMNKI